MRRNKHLKRNCTARFYCNRRAFLLLLFNRGFLIFNFQFFGFILIFLIFLTSDSIFNSDIACNDFGDYLILLCCNKMLSAKRPIIDVSLLKVLSSYYSSRTNINLFLDILFICLYFSHKNTLYITESHIFDLIMLLPNIIDNLKSIYES